MKKEELGIYICPATQETLTFKDIQEQDGDVLSGFLVSESGVEYPIVDGIPDLTYPPVLPNKDQVARVFYDNRSDVYDKYLHLTFRTHHEDEQTVRNGFIDLLDLKANSRVLEIACGTGRDSEIIAQRLGPDGQLCLQDISPGMLSKCRERLSGSPVQASYGISNALYLPYQDGYFDAIYSFGGIGEFSDIRRSLAEMVRVSKVGAKIVFGDESIPTWLRETEFAKILVTTNKQFLARVPLDDMPIEARKVCLRWVIGGVFYLIEFEVGKGEPEADFDFEIPGIKGGTLRTRYLGQLEGVKPETKLLAEQAREKRGISMHQWLDEVVSRAALRDLEDKQ